LHFFICLPRTSIVYACNPGHWPRNNGSTESTKDLYNMQKP
jgi:hypothetical protein